MGGEAACADAECYTFRPNMPLATVPSKELVIEGNL